MRVAWAVVLVACAKHDKPAAPAAGSAAPAVAAVALHTKLVGCAPAELAPRGERPLFEAIDLPSTESAGFLGTGSDSAIAITGVDEVADAPDTPRVFTPLRPRIDVRSAGIDPRIVKRMFARQRGKLDACVKTGKATIEVAITVGADGKVTSVKTDNACIAAVVRATPSPMKEAFGASIALTYGGASAPAPVVPPHISDPKVWTPYAASEALAPNDIATAAATELETAIRAKLPKLDECIGDRTGSVRAMLFVAFDGGVITARVGGLGDHQVDACIASALIGLKVGAPPIVSEVACDLSRGDPAPWRVTADGGYGVKIEAHANGISRYGDLGAESSVLVVADPDASPTTISDAIEVAPVRNAVVVAVKADAGAPVFMGVGFDARTANRGDGEPIAIDLHGTPHACADGDAFATGTPSQLAAALAGRCKTDPCGTLAITLGGKVTARDLLFYAQAARDVGFSRILVGGRGCIQPASPGSGSGSGSDSTSSSGGSGGSAAGGSAPSIARPSSR
ncbi:MAG: hypothetical protein JO257_24695 [Deltaproteobacteria bacterium]|nr:hypothetical protein [Deltaproteobacteria bacterium]